MDVGCYAKSCNPHVLLCSILYAFASASILAYSKWCINVNIYHIIDLVQIPVLHESNIFFFFNMVYQHGVSLLEIY